jgi:hypothetical protein
MDLDSFGLEGGVMCYNQTWGLLRDEGWGKESQCYLLQGTGGGHIEGKDCSYLVLTLSCTGALSWGFPRAGRG